MTPLGDEPRSSRPSVAIRVIGGIALLAGLLAGIVLLGRLADSDVTAMVLTTVFFGVVLVGIVLVVRRRRDWLLPLVAPFVVVVLGAGFVLGRPLVTDDVVDEVVVTADEPAPSAPSPSTTSTTPSAPEPTAVTSPRPATNVKVASGRFEAIAHPGSGTATLIRTASGEVKLTFTSFSTDNGPDVRVYLSRDTKASGRGSSFVELGALKGNKGNQQYDVPADVDLTSIDSIVLWCRAFDVGFIQAPLIQA